MSKLSDFITGNSPMAGSCLITDLLDGRPDRRRAVEIYSFSVHQGTERPYAIMDVRCVDDVDVLVKIRSSSEGVIDKMQTAMGLGAQLPVEATIVERMSKARRKYTDLE